MSENTGRKRLSDILRNGKAEELAKTFQSADAAADFALLPTGYYSARTVSGNLFNAKTGTPGYKICFEITKGEFNGQRIWADYWLTGPAMPLTKRDLQKLGIRTLEQLEQPLPAVFLVRLYVSLRRDDDGNRFNRVRSFDVIGIEPSAVVAQNPEPSPDAGLPPTVAHRRSESALKQASGDAEPTAEMELSKSTQTQNTKGGGLEESLTQSCLPRPKQHCVQSSVSNTTINSTTAKESSGQPDRITDEIPSDAFLEEIASRMPPDSKPLDSSLTRQWLAETDGSVDINRWLAERQKERKT